MECACKLFNQADIQYVETIDATLAVRTFGQGPALVLLHGWPLDGFTWRYLLPSLAEGWTCYVIDLAGLGDSTWSDATDFSFAMHAHRVQQLMETLGVGIYSVLAHDTGATVARLLADSVPERVQRLCLINTEMPDHRPPWIPLYQHVLGLPGSLLIFRKLLAIRAFRESRMVFGGCFANVTRLRGEFHARNVAPIIASGRRAKGVIRYLRGIDWQTVDGLRAIHGRLRVPTTLVWGEDDPTFPLELARKMAEQFSSQPGFVVIKGARLLPHEEAPDAVLAAILPFLRAEPFGHSIGTPIQMGI